MKCPYIQSHIISAILRLRWWDAGSFLFNCCSCCCRLWYWHSFEQKQYCFSFTVSSKCEAVLSPVTQLMMQRQRWCLNKMTLTYIVTNIYYNCNCSQFIVNSAIPINCCLKSKLAHAKTLFQMIYNIYIVKEFSRYILNHVLCFQFVISVFVIIAITMQSAPENKFEK